MPSLFSLAKTAIVASYFMTSLVYAEPAVFEQKAIVDFGEHIWTDAQHVFQATTDRLKEVFHHPSNEFNVFTHPAFSNYALRYKHPSLCDPDVKQISGYLDVDDDKHFFFWFFESRDKPKEDPLVLWLNGGPGCSSLTGLFMELGPCTVNLEGTNTVLNKYSWNEKANVIFLDQPLNVGYSYGSGGATNTNAAAKDVYAFLQLFFKQFPQDILDLDFHASDESSKCDNDQIDAYLQMVMNTCDARKKCEDGNLCYETVYSVEGYLNLPEVMEVLGTETDKYFNCNDELEYKCIKNGDFMLPYVNLIFQLLDDNVRILTYAGDDDFILNWMDNKYIDKLGKQADELCGLDMLQQWIRGELS
ncbi:hypothetical protein G6F40_006629 [Rhizopus arrhizus]|nr:hypothetical protein G6F20_007471 [Rhizopus arrhizus]KAG1112406.1 hypothetical protein G6F40_006629 [Rhizopus arrhizus]